jgi:hypothetical protein
MLLIPKELSVILLPIVFDQGHIMKVEGKVEGHWIEIEE